MINYKSELINKILEQRGHEKSSLHYESECVDSWINEAKGAYPKLADYESEWLNYIVENPIGEFPYETIIDVTDATVDNVVPYAYKSAIFKGQTLVNLATRKTIDYTASTDWDGYNQLVQYSLGEWESWRTLFDLKPNTKYYISCYVETFESASTTNYLVNNASSQSIFPDKMSINGVGRYQWVSTSKSTIEGEVKVAIRCQNERARGKIKIKDFMLIEYIDGMENWDIPYFEGMESVKMPVLMVYNQENLFKNYIKDGSQWGKDGNCTTTDIKYSQNGSYVKITGNNSLCFSGFVSPSLPRGTYKFSCKIKVGKIGDSYKILVHNTPNGSGNKTNGFASDKITSTKEIETFEYVGYFANANNMLFYAYYKGQEIEYYDIVFTKLSDDDVTTNTQSYTYKSNILTVNEDVELRGIGDVTDELDLLTGELTQRIGEIVLDGSEDWKENGTDKTIKELRIATQIRGDDTNYLLSDKLNVSRVYTTNEDIGICIVKNGDIYNTLRIRTQETKNGQTLSEFKTWLSQNPNTVQYAILDESIKTVDLSVIDQDGNTLSQIKPLEGTMHISTDGTPLKPTVSMEIPVEAITQNLCSFIGEE